MKKYKIKWIPWWDGKYLKNGVSITKWVAAPNELRVSVWAIIMFDKSKSDVPEERPVVAVRRDIMGKQLSKLTKASKNALCKKLENEAVQEVLAHKKALIKTGYYGVITQ